jgi:hypothetical protein
MVRLRMIPISIALFHRIPNRSLVQLSKTVYLRTLANQPR